MTRLQRFFAIFLISLVFPVSLWAAAFEMLTISSAAVGPTTNLCSVGTPQAPAELRAYIQILDQSIFYTIHSPTATPSSTLGGLAPANTIMVLDRASDFRAIRATASDARAYIVCVPK